MGGEGGDGDGDGENLIPASNSSPGLGTNSSPYLPKSPIKLESNEYR